MSDHNRFEDLRDEERSHESDDTPGSLKDFIAPEGNAGVLPTQDQRSGIPVFVSSLNQGSVSIFDTSDRASGVGRRGSVKVDSVIELGGGRTAGDQKGPTKPDGTAGRGELNVNDLGSYQGTTVSGLSHSAKVFPRPSGGGETKVDRLIGKPGRKTEHETQALFSHAATGAPLGSGGSQGGNIPGRGFSKPGTDQPRKSMRPKAGEVILEWESHEEAEPDNKGQFSEEEIWLLEGARLDEMQAEAEKQLEEVMAKCRELHNLRNRHMERSGAFGVFDSVAERELMVTEYEEGSAIMGQVLLHPDKREELQIRPCDLVIGIYDAWKTDWTLFENSKETHFGKLDVEEIMEHANRLLEDLRMELTQIAGPEEFSRFEARHRRLAAGLLQDKIPVSLASLFPRESAAEIIQWYLRWVSGLMVLQRQREVRRLGDDQLKKFMIDYPGPKGDGLGGTAVNPRSSLFSASGRFAKSDQPTRSGFHHTGLGGQRKGEVGSSGFDHNVANDLRAKTVAERFAGPHAENPEFMQYGGRQGLTWDKVREEAVGYGYNYRRPDGPEFDHPINFLGSSQVRRKTDVAGGTAGRQDGSQIDEYSVGSSSHPASRRSQASSRLEGDSLEGFEGMDRTDIEEEVRTYVTEQLEMQGNATPLAINILVDNIPKLGVYTRKGHSAAVTSSFAKHVRDIKPYVDGPFISMPQWWRKLREKADDCAWSTAMLVRFVGRTGGLAPNTNEGVRTRALDLMEHYQSWLSHYEPQRPETDNRYWLYLWLDIGLKFIREFYMVQNQDVIEDGLTELFKDEKYVFTSKTDPLNEDFHRICSLYEAMNLWLIERSSDMINAPVYVYRKMRNWLKDERGLAGNIAATLIDKALAKLSTDPESVLPRHHMLTRRQLEVIKRQGQGETTASTYRLILERLKNRAVERDLEYTATSMHMLYSLQEPEKISQNDGHWEKSKTDRKRERRTHNVMSSDMSTLTLNTAITSQVTPRHQPCQICGMFHGPPQKDHCPFWDPAKRVFNTLNYLFFRTVRSINANDGLSSINDFWLKKLKLFGFRGMGITDEDEKQKIIKDLKDAAARLPPATPEERRRWAADNQQFIHIAKIEEGVIAKQLVNAATSKTKPKSQTAKATKSKEGEADSTSSSGSSGAGLGSSDDSEDLH